MAENLWNGLIPVFKEAGYTSNDVVAKLRGILKQRKIGHTGTLDPDAVGVLVVCLGSATKLVPMMTEHDKEYIATVKLGVVTDTQDLSGKVISTGDASAVTGSDVSEALRAFKGTYEQIPPMYSAVRVGGKHLYELARKGRTVEREPRSVEIKAISLLDDSALKSDGVFTMEVRCSKGTYIRTLCHDIGERLGCGAAMAQLTRTCVGSFRIEDALKLSDIEALRDEGTLSDYIVSSEDLFRDLDRLDVDPGYQKWLKNGNSFSTAYILPGAPEDENDIIPEDEEFRDGEMFRVYCDGEWYGVYKYSAATGRFRVYRFFYGTVYADNS